MFENFTNAWKIDFHQLKNRRKIYNFPFHKFFKIPKYFDCLNYLNSKLKN